MSLYRMKEYAMIGREIILLRSIKIGSFETQPPGRRFMITGMCGGGPRNNPFGMFYGLTANRVTIAFYFRDEGDEWKLV